MAKLMPMDPYRRKRPTPLTTKYKWAFRCMAFLALAEGILILVLNS